MRVDVSTACALPCVTVCVCGGGGDTGGGEGNASRFIPGRSVG